MAEETEVLTPEKTEVPLGESTMAEFKKARADGAEVVKREAAPVEKEEETEEKDDAAPKPKAKGGFQARIDRLIKQQSMTEEELSKRDKRIQELEAKLNGEVPKTEQPKAEGEPQREQFGSEGEYLRAVMRWEARQELKAEREEEERKAAAEQQKEAVTNYNKKAIEAQSRHEDWKEVMSQNINIPTTVGEAIIHTIKNGPDVAYFLGKNPEICEEMMNVHPLEAVAMAVKISEQLETSGKPEVEEAEEELEEKVEAKQERRAPKPIVPIAGAKTRSTVPLDKVSFSDYKKARAAGRVQ